MEGRRRERRGGQPPRSTALAFRHSATAVWNNLPAVIRSTNSLHVFKRRLKTRLHCINVGANVPEKN